MPTQSTSEALEFSSPLVVKVRKEVAKERREELDLETGRRRSWVEAREFDVLDLTGDMNHPPDIITAGSYAQVSLQCQYPGMHH